MSQDYSVNERALCYHGAFIYEAKILKSETFSEATSPAPDVVGKSYFVHYKGWKQSWDEWVNPSRLLKLNEENLALQKSLMQAARAATSASSSKDKGKISAKVDTRNRKDGARGTKRGRDDEDSRKIEMRLDVPEDLKQYLLDDWENVTKNQQLVPLPKEANLTVAHILLDFKAHLLKQGKQTQLRDPELLLPTIIAGLITYFDKSIGTILLYRFERAQYSEMKKKFVTGQNVVVGEQKEMSEVYGAEHLLRMLVGLPKIIATSSMDAESISFVREYVNELLKFLVVEKKRLFAVDYDSAGPQYQNISRS